MVLLFSLASSPSSTLLALSQIDQDRGIAVMGGRTVDIEFGGDGGVAALKRDFLDAHSHIRAPPGADLVFLTVQDKKRPHRRY